MNNWTLADFLTYIYQLVADSDYQTADEEITIVKRQVGWVLANYFGEREYSYTDSLRKIQETEGVSLLNCKEVILQMMPKFEFSHSAKKDIYTDLLAIAASDNKVSSSERDTLSFIKQSFSMVDMPLSWLCLKL